MQIENYFYYYTSALSPDVCQKIIDLGDNQIKEEKLKGNDVSGTTFGFNHKQEDKSKEAHADETLEDRVKKSGKSTEDVVKNSYIRDSEITWLNDEWIYDKIFSLWKEHQNVVLERNPWATYQLTPRDAMIVGYLSQLIRNQNLENDKIQRECDWVDKWVFAATELEAFDRMVKELDKILDEPVPDLHIFPEGTVRKVREKVTKTEV